jgi:type VI protein secretion system component VasF
MDDKQRTSRPGGSPDGGDGNSARPIRNLNLWIVITILGLLGMLAYLGMREAETDDISLGYFKNLIRGRDYYGKPLEKDGKPFKGSAIQQVQLTGHIAEGTLRQDVSPMAEPRFDGRGREIDPQPGQSLKRKFRVTLMNNPESLRDLEKELNDAGVPVSAVDTTGIAQLMNFLLLAFSIGILLFLFYSFRRSQNQA